MRTEGPRFDQPSSETYEWYLSYLRAFDTKDLETCATFLADDRVPQANNCQPVVRKTAILEGLSYYWTTFDPLAYDLPNHYERNDGEAVTPRAAATSRNGRNRP